MKTALRSLMLVLLLWADPVQSAQLTWQDNSADETSFTIWRKAEACAGSLPFTQLGSVGADVVTYADPVIAPGTYAYQVRAENASGASEFSNCAEFVVAAPPPGPTVTVSVTGDPSAGAYVVEAVVSPVGAWQLDFTVDGLVNRRERTPLYCLFGGDARCNPGRLGSGQHVIAVDLRDQRGSGVLASARVTVSEGSVVSDVDVVTRSLPVDVVRRPVASGVPPQLTADPGVRVRVNGVLAP